jgi:hypothetical protein
MVSITEKAISCHFSFSFSVSSFLIRSVQTHQNSLVFVTFGESHLNVLSVLGS